MTLKSKRKFIIVPLLNAVGLMVSLISTAIIARAISPTSFGLYQIAFSIAAILSLISLPGMAQATTQSVARGFFGTYRGNISLVILSSGIASLIILSMYLFAAIGPNLGVKSLLLVLALCYTPYYGMRQWATYQNGRGKYTLTAGVNFTGNLLILATIFTFYSLDALTLVNAFAISFVIPSLLHALGFALTKPHGTRVEIGSRDYGVKTTVFLIPNILSNHADKFILLASLDLASVGLFAVAERVTEAAKSVIQSAVSLLAPRYARSEWSLQLSREVMLASLVGAIAIILISIFAIQPIVVACFGDEYAEGAKVAVYMFLTLVFVVPATMQFRFIQSKLDVDAFKRIQVSISIVRIMLSVILIPIWGIWGAVASLWLYRMYMVFVVSLEISRYKRGSGDVSPSEN